MDTVANIGYSEVWHRWNHQYAELSGPTVELRTDTQLGEYFRGGASVTAVSIRRYGTVAAGGAWIGPYIDVGSATITLPVGAGLAWTDVQAEEVSTRLNALLHAGVSVSVGRYEVTVRWQHISNAGTHAPNIGIDWIASMIGIRF